MDPTIATGFGNLTLLGSQRNQMQSHVDHSVLERMNIQAGDPAAFADMTAASFVPTAQPYIVPGFIRVTGVPVGT